MRIDNYTRFLLTVITLCLLYICMKDSVRIPKVHADSPLEVVLVDHGGQDLSSISYDPTTKHLISGPHLAVRIEDK